MKKASHKLTEEQRAALRALNDLPEDQVDTSDAPEILDWSGAITGAFYRPVKQEVILKLDEYMIDWFEDNASEGQDYKEHIIQALWDHIRKNRSRSSEAAKEAKRTGQDSQRS